MGNTKAGVTITLYMDADVHGKLAQQLRNSGYDVISAYEAGNAALNDPEQLEFAVSQGRAILTCNAKDFAPLFQEYWRQGRSHYGIIVSQQLSIGDFVRRTTTMLESVDADEMIDRYCNLAEFDIDD
ncbi:MAG TPA: DUF5615 family PIN-like protein [Anaerolineae bacterium]|nr:DUF5615 family PIN-like protein [Anaerolineae bacterium]